MRYVSPNPSNGKGQRTIAQHTVTSKEGSKGFDKLVKQELPHVMDGKFPARRFERDTKDGVRVIINRIFYDETINKHQEDILYSLKLAYAKKAHELISDA